MNPGCDHPYSADLESHVLENSIGLTCVYPLYKDKKEKQRIYPSVASLLRHRGKYVCMKRNHSAVHI